MKPKNFPDRKKARLAAAIERLVARANNRLGFTVSERDEIFAEAERLSRKLATMPDAQITKKDRRVSPGRPTGQAKRGGG